VRGYEVRGVGHRPQLRPAGAGPTVQRRSGQKLTTGRGCGPQGRPQGQGRPNFPPWDDATWEMNGVEWD